MVDLTGKKDKRQKKGLGTNYLAPFFGTESFKTEVRGCFLFDACLL